MADQGVYGALAAAQAEFPAIPKTHTATVTSEKGRYTYNYADLSDIVAAVRPVLSKHKLALLQPVEMLENGRLALRTSIVHADGSGIHSMMHLPNMEGKPQAFGSALTYARRYALSSLIGIATEEDDDGTAAQDPGPTERTSRPTQRPAASKPRPVETPEAAVERATREADAKADPWNLAKVPESERADLMLMAIDSRPWPEVQSAMAAYRGRVDLTDEQKQQVNEAYVARRDAVRQQSLPMAG